MNIDHSLPSEVRDRLGLDSNGMLKAGLATRSRAHVVEMRVRPSELELRENEDGTTSWVGYALTWDTWYDVAGGPPFGWSETITRGALSKSLAENADVRFLANHEGLPMARTRSQTLTLAPDDLGLLIEVPNPDMRNPKVQELDSCLRRKDVDQMSWAFIATRQQWNSDYTERSITEARIFDVSAVTYPANEATIIGARSASQIDERQTEGMSLDLALALAQSLHRS